MRQFAIAALDSRGNREACHRAKVAIARRMTVATIGQPHNFEPLLQLRRNLDLGLWPLVCLVLSRDLLPLALASLRSHRLRRPASSRWPPSRPPASFYRPRLGLGLSLRRIMSGAGRLRARSCLPPSRLSRPLAGLVGVGMGGALFSLAGATSLAPMCRGPWKCPAAYADLTE
jgi:hypothetical protein